MWIKECQVFCKSPTSLYGLLEKLITRAERVHRLQIQSGYASPSNDSNPLDSFLNFFFSGFASFALLDSAGLPMALRFLADVGPLFDDEKDRLVDSVFGFEALAEPATGAAVWSAACSAGSLGSGSGGRPLSVMKA
jgi:hypothetical protein